MAELFPGANFPFCRDGKGRVPDVRKKDLRVVIERWTSPDMDHLLTRHERVIVRSLASDVDFLIRGGRFNDHSHG